MLAWTLNTNAENGSSSGAGRRRRRPARGVGDGARSTTPSSSRRTPKLVSAEPKNTGVVSPARNASCVEVVPDGAEQLELLARRLAVGPVSATASTSRQLLARLAGAAGHAA